MSETRPQAPNGASLVGEVLGSYRLVEELSQGGMGTVYRAQHELLDRPAAIKLLRPELSSNDVLVQRFFNEAKAATAIRHPGIVEVYDFGYTDDGRAYLVMEFLDGEALRARLVRRGRLTELEVVSIARGIASALKAAHAKSIVHRDLKPDNVFLVPDPDGSGDRVKVLDFGVAKLADPSPSNARRTQTGVLMGTPLYMAPEQARAAGLIDHRADLYSLGCIIYELLVGKPPFLAEGAGEIIALQLFGQVQRPSERAPGITPEMDAIVMRLLEKEPHDRHQSAAEVQHALAGVGATLSARLSAELAPGVSRQLIPPTPLASSGSLRLGLIDQPPEPEKRSVLPIVAGIVTVLLAAAAVFFVMTRGSDDFGDRKPDTGAAISSPDRNPGGGAASAVAGNRAGAPTSNPGGAAASAPINNPGGAAGAASNPGGAPTSNPGGAAASAPINNPGGAAASNPGGAKRPKAGKRGTAPAASDAGPVVRPDTADAPKAADGPTTRPGMHTAEGAPIEPDLGEPKKPKDP